MEPVSELHAAARRFAENGVPVFACAPGSKEPVAGSRGFHDATTDLATIDQWWADEPRLNVAFCPHQVGLAVIDPDGVEGEATWADWQVEHGYLPETYTVKTPRGGRHLYFKGVLPATQSKLGPHVDTRGVGSYVLVPPSYVEGHGHYEVIDDREAAELPETVPAFLEKLRRDHAKATVDDLDLPANVARARKLLTDYVARGHVAIEGQMGDGRTFAVACEVMNLGLSPDGAFDLLAEVWNPACSPPWDEDELRIKVENASRYAQNEPGAWAVEPAADVFAKAVAALPQEPERTPGITFKPDAPTAYPIPKSAADLAAGTFPRAEYALERFVLRRHVNLLYGDGGTGKTLLAETWAAAVAAGLPWCDLATRQMPALLILAEDDDGETKARLEAICAAMECDLAGLPITVWCLPGWDTTIAHIQDDGTWEPGPFLAPLKAELARIGPCLLILDTVSDIAALDETKRLPVNTLCKGVLTGLCREFGATVLVNAHPSKASMSDGSGYAGSTAWNNAVRNRLTLERTDAGNPRRVLKVAKSNYGQDTELELFQLGLTFVTGKATAGIERAALLREACVKVATMAAEQGAPLQHKRRLNKWQVDEIEIAAGYRPTERDVKEELASAMHAGRLRYVKGTNLLSAGYYPFDPHRAEELARQARKISAGGSDAEA